MWVIFFQVLHITHSLSLHSCLTQGSGNSSFSEGQLGSEGKRREHSTSSETTPLKSKHPSLKNFKSVNSIDSPSHASRFCSSYRRSGKKARTMKKRPSDISILEHPLAARPNHHTTRQRKTRPVSVTDVAGYSRSGQRSSCLGYRGDIEGMVTKTHAGLYIALTGHCLHGQWKL